MLVGILHAEPGWCLAIRPLCYGLVLSLASLHMSCSSTGGAIMTPEHIFGILLQL